MNLEQVRDPPASTSLVLRLQAQNALRFLCGPQDSVKCAAGFTNRDIMATHLFFSQTFSNYLLVFKLCLHVCTCTHTCPEKTDSCSWCYGGGWDIWHRCWQTTLGSLIEKYGFLNAGPSKGKLLLKQQNTHVQILYRIANAKIINEDTQEFSQESIPLHPVWLMSERGIPSPRWLAASFQPCLHFPNVGHISLLLLPHTDFVCLLVLYGIVIVCIYSAGLRGCNAGFVSDETNKRPHCLQWELVCLIAYRILHCQLHSGWWPFGCFHMFGCPWITVSTHLLEYICTHFFWAYIQEYNCCVITHIHIYTHTHTKRDRERDKQRHTDKRQTDSQTDREGRPMHTCTFTNIHTTKQRV